MNNTIDQPSAKSDAGMVDRVAALARDMRSAGSGSNLVQAMEAVRALHYVDIASRADVRAALRSALASSPTELHLFDYYFETRFSALDRTPPAVSQDQNIPPKKAKAGAWLDPSGDFKEPEAENGKKIALAGSLAESGTVRDFAFLDQAEADEMLRRVRELARALAGTIHRRQKVNGNLRIDFRKTFRGSLQTGGEPLDLKLKGRKPRPGKLLLMGDVSGSMEVYTRFLMAFVSGLVEVLPRTEVFLFSTRSKRITHLLKTNRQWLREAAKDVLKTGGGTDIGGSFMNVLNGRHSGVLGPRTRIMIVSDGWDRGDPKVLEQAMDRFRRRSAGIVWLNPLAGDAGYEPLTSGLTAALPYVDAHLPFRNLYDLKRLTGWFMRSLRAPALMRARGNMA